MRLKNFVETQKVLTNLFFPNTGAQRRKRRGIEESELKFWCLCGLLLGENTVSKDWEAPMVKAMPVNTVAPHKKEFES